MTSDEAALIRWFEDVDNDDVAEVGGKNASLGEMIDELGERDMRVPGGFATTAAAYRRFVEVSDLGERIREEITRFQEDDRTLEEVGAAIRHMFLSATFPDESDEAIRSAYRQLSDRYETVPGDSPSKVSFPDA